MPHNFLSQCLNYVPETLIEDDDYPLRHKHCSLCGDVLPENNDHPYWCSPCKNLFDRGFKHDTTKYSLHFVVDKNGHSRLVNES